MVRDIEPFFVGAERFTTFTFFSQSGRNSPAYKFYPFSFSYHSNMVDLLCFLAYATTNLVGSNSHGFTKIVACRPLGGMGENPRSPNSSWPKEFISFCQYPCIWAIQRPSLWELRMVTTVKCLLQNSKALRRKKGRTKVVVSKIKIKSSSMS